MGVNYWLLVKF